MEQGEATRAALVRAAQRLFARKGYAATATEEIVRAARVTRGALYHHFSDKEELFRAVFETTEAQMLERVIGVAADTPTPLAQLQVAVDAFLEACLDPTLRRIVLQEGPAVLGWATWQEIDSQYAYGAVSAGLQEAMDSGELEAQPVEPLAHLVVGSIMQAGLVVARADDQKAESAAIGRALHRMLDGLRPAAERARATGTRRRTAR
ncbi:MAG TPA: helix-turn-helix domain-containing protein [Acidimicrobiales bacterium]|nr:helix-turn-helix domain-containing protein [Acidimicrobiales bacterium]